METTFIYFLRDPKNPCKGYLGKTDEPGTRLRRHINECRKEKFHRANWLNDLVARGLKPTLEIVDEISVQEWPFWEREYIRLFRAIGVDLVNGTPGGDGFGGGEKHPQFGKKTSPEICAKIRAALTGTKNLPELCAKKRIKKPAATSQFHGVSKQRTRPKWRARIHVNSKDLPLGTFSDESEAAKAYDDAAVKYHGEHAVLNFPK